MRSEDEALEACTNSSSCKVLLLLDPKQDLELIVAPFQSDQRKSSRDSRCQGSAIGKATTVPSLIRPCLVSSVDPTPHYRPIVRLPWCLVSRWACAFQLPRIPFASRGCPSVVGRAGLIDYRHIYAPSLEKSDHSGSMVTLAIPFLVYPHRDPPHPPKFPPSFACP